MASLVFSILLFAASVLGLQEEGKSPVDEVGSPLLLVDDSTQPTVSIGWTTASGEAVNLSGVREWGSDATRKPLGRNVSAFAAAGGIRLMKSAGHPAGAIVRVGFYKIDAGAPFFEDIAAGSVVSVEMRGIRFNQAAVPRPKTILQHMKFSLEALKSCRLASNAWNLFNTADPKETLNGQARAGYDLRAGALSGLKPGDGTCSAVREEDGSITLHAEIPYGLFKHIRDPWARAIPGTFLEPIHFHVEVEVLPEKVAAELEEGEREQAAGDD